MRPAGPRDVKIIPSCGLQTQLGERRIHPARHLGVSIVVGVQTVAGHPLGGDPRSSAKRRGSSRRRWRRRRRGPSPMMTSTDAGRSSVYQNGSTTMKRASGSSAFRVLQVLVDRGMDLVRREVVAEVVVEPHRDEHDVGILRDHLRGQVDVGPAVVHEAEAVDAGVELVPAALGADDRRPAPRGVGRTRSERVRVAVEGDERGRRDRSRGAPRRRRSRPSARPRRRARAAAASGSCLLFDTPPARVR